MLQINLNNACHLKCLAWAVYDGALLVGSQPELPGDCQWCTMLASIYKHIYRGCNDAAHCPPYTLASWDYLQRTKALHEEQRWGAAWCGHKNAPRTRRRRSRSSSRCHSRMPSHRGWSRYSCCFPPNTPLRCHCGEPLSQSSNTTPKLSLAMSVPAYARSSCLVGRWCGPPWMMVKMKRTSRPHTPPVCHMVWQEGAIRVNQLSSEWRPPREVQPGGCLPKWTSARRSPRPWKRLTLTGGHSGHCK